MNAQGTTAQREVLISCQNPSDLIDEVDLFTVALPFIILLEEVESDGVEPGVEPSSGLYEIISTVRDTYRELWINDSRLR